MDQVHRSLCFWVLTCLTGAQKGQALGLSTITTPAAHPTPQVSVLGEHQAPGQVASTAGVLSPAQVPASVPTWCVLGTVGQSHLLITTPLLSRRKVKPTWLMWTLR